MTTWTPRTGEGVQIDRQRGDEGFSLAGLHFRDYPAVEGDAADELDVEVDHLPFDGTAVDNDFAAEEPAGGVFDDGVGFGENLLQIPGAGFPELAFDLMEGGFRRFNRRCGGGDVGRERRELLAQNG